MTGMMYCISPEKWRSYKGALRRQTEGGAGWLIVKGKGAAADVFVPFAFEVGGALGREAEESLRECTAVAEWKNQGVGCPPKAGRKWYTRVAI